MNKTEILGINFTPADKAEVYRNIEKLIFESCNARIFTPNAEILYRASKDEELTDLLNSADMLLPDGIGVILASRMIGSPLPCRITGIDTAEYVLQLAASKGLSVFLLGGAQGVAVKAKTALEKRIDGLCICGTHHGYFDLSGKGNEEVIKKIIDARPDILFVCLGFPRQEKWIAENTHRLPFLRLSMGLGGSLDVWSGNVRRAPKAVQRMGLEWLFRSLSSSKRMLRLPYVFLFAKKAVSDKFKKSRLLRSDLR